MIKLLIIALGGAIGTALRYGVSGAAYQLFGPTFPWGTLSVNLIGALCVGFLAALFEAIIVPPVFKTFLLIGVLGGFTTFSTYTVETFNLFRDGEFKLALSNMLVSNIAGVVLVIAGFIACRWLMTVIR